MEAQANSIKQPSHYKGRNGVETIDMIYSILSKEEFVGACKFNVLKYVARCNKKGDMTEDLSKAKRYLDWLLAETTGSMPEKPSSL